MSLVGKERQGDGTYLRTVLAANHKKVFVSGIEYYVVLEHCHRIHHKRILQLISLFELDRPENLGASLTHSGREFVRDGGRYGVFSAGGSVLCSHGKLEAGIIVAIIRCRIDAARDACTEGKLDFGLLRHQRVESRD